MLEQLDFEDSRTIVNMVRHIAGDELSNSQVQHLAQIISLAYGKGQLVGTKTMQQIFNNHKEENHHD